MVTEPTLHSLEIQLTRIEGKLDAHIGTLENHIREDGAIHADLEKRVRANEKAKWMLSGVAAFIAAAVSAVGTLIGVK